MYKERYLALVQHLRSEIAKTRDALEPWFTELLMQPSSAGNDEVDGVVRQARSDLQSSFCSLNLAEELCQRVLKEVSPVGEQFDEVMVEAISQKLRGQGGPLTPLFVIRAVLVALSQTHAIVPKAEYDTYQALVAVVFNPPRLPTELVEKIGAARRCSDVR